MRSRRPECRLRTASAATPGRAQKQLPRGGMKPRVPQAGHTVVSESNRRGSKSFMFFAIGRFHQEARIRKQGRMVLVEIGPLFQTFLVDINSRCFNFVVFP